MQGLNERVADARYNGTWKKLYENCVQPEYYHQVSVVVTDLAQTHIIQGKNLTILRYVHRFDGENDEYWTADEQRNDKT